MPSDLLARRFDLIIRHDLWLLTKKGGAELAQHARQMLRYWRRYRRAYAALAQVATRNRRPLVALHFAWQKTLLCPADPHSWAELALLCWTVWRVEVRRIPPPLWTFPLPTIALFAAKNALQLHSLKNLAFKRLISEQLRFVSAIIKAKKR